MKQAWIFFATLGVVAGALSPGLHARDRELQAVLTEAACVPTSITTKEPSAAVTWYEVACRGGKRTLVVLCLPNECWLQPARLEDEKP